MLVDDDDRLVGLFTDSDLVRLLETRRYDALDEAIELVMTKHVQTVVSGTLLGAAIEVLAGRKISELPVIDAQRRPIGLLDITDVIAVGETSQATPATLPLHGQTNSGADRA
jgi:arabinose-5-phosphate isomerase